MRTGDCGVIVVVTDRSAEGISCEEVEAEDIEIRDNGWVVYERPRPTRYGTDTVALPPHRVMEVRFA